VRFAGVGRRFELVGVHGGVMVYDDYGHNPTELAVTLRTARSLTSGRVIAVYQPHVVERTRQLHQELGDALGLADAAIVTDIIDARDTPRDGVSGKLVVDSLPPGVRAGWAPSPDDAALLALAWARSGDLVITFGVGEPWKIANAIVDGLRP
jgi:UDP-N-acetylmuramate--alanine ligase